jgi:hypothetical protein
VEVFPAPLRVLGDTVSGGIFRLLDTPTSALNAVLPFGWRCALAVQFAQAPMSFGWSGLRGYLLVGFTAYSFLGFGLMLLYRNLAHKSRGQREIGHGGA